MQSFWKPFGEPLRRAIVLAQQEAERLGGGSLGTEHLLLGIVAEGENPAAHLLDGWGLGIERTRETVSALGLERRQPIRPGELVFSGNAKGAIERCFEVAREAGHGTVGTEHMLVALARLPKGGAHSVFESLIGADRMASFCEEAERVMRGAEPVEEAMPSMRLGVIGTSARVTDAEARLYAACLQAADGEGGTQERSERANRLYKDALAAIFASRSAAD